MAVTEDIEKQVIAEAYEVTPNYSVDYNDPRFGKVESEEKQALTELEQTYGGVIGSTDNLYDDQIQASKDWADKQTALQQEQTDFAIEKIEQQKDQAHKDYVKEQSGAFVDWQKQSNQYGAEAEKIASAGLTNTGYSESSQVSMYNTYQNRVATAREVYNRAVLNYDNAIKDAILQNNATLAEIAHTALREQIDLAINKVMYNNTLVLELADKKTQTKQFYYQQWQDVLNQINTENALAEDARQFDVGLEFTATENQKDREHQATENQKDRDFQAKEAELTRKHQNEDREDHQRHDKEMLDAETAAEKELLKIKHAQEDKAREDEQQHEMYMLAKQYSYKNTSSGSGGGSGTGAITKTTKTTKATDVFGAPALKLSFSSYDKAVDYMKSKGVPSSAASGAMTLNEWSRRKTSYSMTGQGGAEVKNYNTYTAYLSDYVDYCMNKYVY